VAIRIATRIQESLFTIAILIVQTRNVLDCDQSNYSSRIIFSCTITLEPNMKSIRRPVPEIWPFEIFQDGGQPPSLIWSNRKWVHSIRRPRKPYPRTKHEVDRMTRSWDMAVRNFTKCKVGRLVGRRSVGPQYYTLFSYTPLRYVRNVAERSKNESPWRRFELAECFLLA